MSNRKWPEPKKQDGRVLCPICKDQGKERDYKNYESYARHCRKKHKEAKKQKAEVPKPLVEKIEKVEAEENLAGSKDREATLEELYEIMVEFAQKQKDLDIVQEKIDIEFEGGWVGLTMLSDLHIGKKEVDYEYIDRLIELVDKYPHLYCGISGDLIENWVKYSPASGGWDEVLKPRYQIEVAEHKIRTIKDKILFIIQGNHEWRSEKQGEISPLERIAKDLGIPYLGHGGRVNIKINDIEYQSHFRHKFRYESSLNPCHACRRLVEVLDSSVDIVGICHKHNAAVRKMHWGGKWRSFMRYGAAYPTSSFEQYIGYPKAQLVAPTVLMSGARKQHTPVLEMEVVEEYLKRRR